MNISIKLYPLFIPCAFFVSMCATAQVNDTAVVKNLKEIKLVGYKSMNGIGHFNEVNGVIIYAGKKNGGNRS